MPAFPMPAARHVVVRRGISLAQDSRFKSADKKLLAKMKFAAELDQKVDLNKVEISTPDCLLYFVPFTHAQFSRNVSISRRPHRAAMATAHSPSRSYLLLTPHVPQLHSVSGSPSA
jgi:hypothetical protein